MLDGSWARAPARSTVDGDAWAQRLVAIGLTVAVGIGYFLAVRLSLALLSTPDGVAAFWPAAGIAAGTLVALGPSARTPVVVGVTVASILGLIGERSLPATLVFTMINAGQAMLISWLIERHHGPRFCLDTLPRVLGFFLATAITMALGGAGGAAGFALFQASEMMFLTAWVHWFASSVVGVVTVAPLIIGVTRALQDPPDLSGLVEGVFILAVLAFAGVLGFGWSTDHWFTILPLAMLLPLLVWPAARCPTVFAAAAVFILALVVVCTTTFGVGRLGDASVPFSDRVLAAQSALMAVSACALIVAALFAERRSREVLLATSNERLRTQAESFRQLLGALPAAIYTTDKAGRLTYCNQAAVDLWGRRPELGKDKWSDLWRLHYPDGTSVPLGDRPTQIVLNEGRAVRGREALLERPDGALVPIMPCPAPLIDQQGTVVGVVNMQIDLTERKRTQAQLAEREAQLSLFVEHAPAAIAMFDGEMRYLAVSRRFVVDFRLPPDAQLIGRSHYEVFPEIPQRWRDIHARVLAGEELSNEEDQFTRQDGRTDWVRWSMTPWLGGDGRIGGAVLFVEVRTEQVEARRALADSEARFRATFENAAVGVALVGSDGSIQRVNDSFARMLGYSAEELQTRTFQDLTHPDDLAPNLSLLNKTLVGEAQSYSIEKRYVRKDGSIVWANLTAGCVRKTDNAVDYFISVIQDITDRKQAEARLAERNAQLDLAHKAARVGSYTYDLIARTMRISRASAAIYGLSPSTMEITAQQWCARVHRDDMQRLRAEHIRAFKERRRELVNEFRLVRPGGEVRWIEARSLVAYDDAGRAERMTGVYIDVTERKQAEAVLRESESRLADALAAGQVIAFEWDAVTRQSRRSCNATLILGHEGGRDPCGLQCDHNFFRRVHPDDRGCFKACISALCPDKPSYALSFRFRSPDGRQLWLEETAKGEFDGAGRLLRIKGLTRNITDRTNAERALAERNMQLSLAGKAALVGSFSTDFETEEVQFSEGYAAIHSLPEGTSHTTRSIWKAGVHPEDARRVDEMRSRVFREQRGEYGIEYRIVRSTGEVRWIEARCFISYRSDGRPQRVVGVDIDVTARRRAEERQRILVAELDHRVKNVLACVAAVAQQSRECSRSADEFLEVLNGRINSLANAHALLSRSRWEGVGLGELVRSELARCIDGDNVIEGPDIVLVAEATQPLAMVLHELTTNATKYGALSSRNGRVSVCWERQKSGCNSHGGLALEWRETGGPPIVVPGPSGYGSSVIRDLIPYELGGSVDYVLAPEGVSCRVEIPAKWLRNGRRERGNRANTAPRLHGVS